MVNMEEVEVGWGVEKGYNGDCYPYYIVGIERGKSISITVDKLSVWDLIYIKP